MFLVLFCRCVYVGEWGKLFNLFPGRGPNRFPVGSPLGLKPWSRRPPTGTDLRAPVVELADFGGGELWWRMAATRLRRLQARWTVTSGACRSLVGDHLSELPQLHPPEYRTGKRLERQDFCLPSQRCLETHCDGCLCKLC